MKARPFINLSSIKVAGLYLLMDILRVILIIMNKSELIYFTWGPVRPFLSPSLRRVVLRDFLPSVYGSQL